MKKNKQKGFSKILIIILVIAIIFVIGIFYLKNNDSGQGQIIQVGLEKTPEVKSIKDELGLNYMIYDGSGDKNVIKNFNNSSLKELQSGSLTLGENFTDTGDGNINVAVDEFVLDKKSDIYIKLITDNQISGFVFKTDSLHKFLSNIYPTPNPTIMQNPKDFIPLKNIQSSYTEMTLDAGNYSIVYIPSEKAVKIDTSIKMK